MIEKGAGAERIEALRAELSQQNVCSFFRTAQDLAARVTAAVANWLSVHDRELAGRSSITPGDLDAYYERLQQQTRDWISTG